MDNTNEILPVDPLVKSDIYEIGKQLTSAKFESSGTMKHFVMIHQHQNLAQCKGSWMFLVQACMTGP